MTDELLTAGEVSAYLRVTEAALAQMRYRGTGPDFVRLGPRSIRYRREDLNRWIESRSVCPQSNVFKGVSRRVS